jgi:hypothetical protein
MFDFDRTLWPRTIRPPAGIHSSQDHQVPPEHSLPMSAVPALPRSLLIRNYFEMLSYRGHGSKCEWW